MKQTIGIALLAFCFITAHADAQTTAKHHKHTAKVRTTISSSDNHARVSDPTDLSNSGAMNTQSTTDPLYLNHPYFNGEARWSHEDTLYKHGDFPWALANKPGSGYTFNPSSGRWEHSGTMGSTTPSR